MAYDILDTIQNMIRAAYNTVADWYLGEPVVAIRVSNPASPAGLLR